jgi:hypothetical protein
VLLGQAWQTERVSFIRQIFLGLVF